MKLPGYLLIILLAFMPASGTVKKNLTHVRMVVNWLPQAQFAGYYIGIEKGIYKKYGLEVELLHPAPGKDSQDLLIEKKADFASVFLPTAIILRSKNYPLVNVCQLSQKSGQVLVSRKSKGITSPSDLDGKKIGIWRNGPIDITKGIINQFKVDVEFIPVNSPVNLFLADGVDAVSAMWYNEYHSILNSGYNPDELNTLFFSGNGLDIPEEGIYCLETNYDKIVTDKFVKATLEAWQYAFDHPAETMKFVKKWMDNIHLPFNKSHQAWMLSRINELFNVKEKKYLKGELLKKDFMDTQAVLLELGLIKKKITFEEFYYGNK
jgi:NitT/TauT family transport system substrate-binding protein